VKSVTAFASWQWQDSAVRLFVSGDGGNLPRSFVTSRDDEAVAGIIDARRARMVPRFLIPSVLLILAGSVSPVPPAAQEVPANVRRVTAVGTYGGTLKGITTRRVANSEIQEKADCDVTLRFRPDGQVEVELRSYLHETTETKRSQAGSFKTVTRITGQSGRIVVDSRLFLVVTSPPAVLVREAKWQREPGPYLPGYVEHEVWSLAGRDQQGREQWRKDSSQPPKSTTVYCHPLVRWRGPKDTGPGLPLNGRWTGPDPERPWVKIDASWDLKLL
jgi:hypothetical protein